MVIAPNQISAVEDLLQTITPDITLEALDRAGRNFHLWIAGLSENSFIFQGVGDAMTRLRRVRWLENNASHQGWDEHRAIVVALKNGEKDMAIALTRAHLIETRQNLLAVLQKSRRTMRARGALLLP